MSSKPDIQRPPLSAERIVATGDLVALPVPLIGNTARPLEYPATLERVLGLQALVYLPGHGPVMRDDAPVRRVLALVKAIRDGVKASVAAGETLEETRRRVDLAAFRESFAGTSRWRGTLFDMYVVQPALEAAWRQAHEATIGTSAWAIARSSRCLTVCASASRPRRCRHS